MDLHSWTLNPDAQYTLAVCGGGAAFIAAWWAVCFGLRQGIDAIKGAAHMVRNKVPLRVDRILLGKWRPTEEHTVQPHAPVRVDIYPHEGWEPL